MLYVLGTITEITALDGFPRELYEFLMPSGELQEGLRGAAVYADEEDAKKLARRHRCKVVPVHSDYVDQLNLVEV